MDFQPRRGVDARMDGDVVILHPHLARYWYLGSMAWDGDADAVSCLALDSEGHSRFEPVPICLCVLSSFLWAAILDEGPSF